MLLWEFPARRRRTSVNVATMPGILLEPLELERKCGVHYAPENLGKSGSLKHASSAAIQAIPEQLPLLPMAVMEKVGDAPDIQNGMFRDRETSLSIR